MIDPAEEAKDGVSSGGITSRVQLNFSLIWGQSLKEPVPKEGITAFMVDSWNF